MWRFKKEEREGQEVNAGTGTKMADMKLRWGGGVCTTVTGGAAFACAAVQLCAQWAVGDVHFKAGHIGARDEHLVVDVEALINHAPVPR